MAATSIARKPTGALAAWRRDPFAAIRTEMNELRARLRGEVEDEDAWFAGTLSPSIDLAETENAVEVRMDLPGVKPNEIDIQLSGNILTVSGQREEEKEEKGRTFHRIERRYGTFSRSVTLPGAVVEDEVAAECRDGVLTVTLPKTKESKAHKIKVRS